jgi:hypothetical protein
VKSVHLEPASIMALLDGIGIKNAIRRRLLGVVPIQVRLSGGATKYRHAFREQRLCLYGATAMTTAVDCFFLRLLTAVDRIAVDCRCLKFAIGPGSRQESG